MKKLLAPILCTLLFAAIMFAENVQSHPGATKHYLIVYAAISVAFGIIFTTLTLAVFIPLAWLAKRRRPPPSS